MECSSRLACRAVDARAVPRAARRAGRSAVRRARTEVCWASSRRDRADLALFHEFEPSPSGGGHQFLRALVAEFARRGLEVELNRLSGGTPACLFNSFNFDPARLRRFAREDCTMVHRVDGPIGVYRGYDDGTDQIVASLNADFANRTVLQSRYSLEKHADLGIHLREPTLIHNAVDPAIFHPPATRDPLVGRRVRLIATSWSDNERKGTATLASLERLLDWERYELTFVGRAPRSFERVQVVGPVSSTEVARLLRAHDVYLAPSCDDPCSNALLEALACGLPAVFRRSGGHPELVGDGGLGFSSDEEIPDVLSALLPQIEERRRAISIPTVEEVAARYLEVLGLAPGAEA
jgi:glycosyltransferase involved in cell wall biosynthesis